jgi:hypothetical protein
MKRFRSIAVWLVALLAVGVVLFCGGWVGLRSLAHGEDILASIKAIPLPAGARSVSYTTESKQEKVGAIVPSIRRVNAGVATYLTADKPVSVFSFYKSALAGEWVGPIETTHNYMGFRREQLRFKGMNVSFPAPTSGPWINVDVDQDEVRSELMIRAYRVYLEDEGAEMTSVQVSLKMW